MKPEEDWYKRNNCTHAHCPNGCEKPQPAMSNGRMLCMKCLIIHGEVSEVVPCTPEVCD